MQPYVDWFKWDGAKNPLSNAPEPKRRFIPSKWESKKVNILELRAFQIMLVNNWFMKCYISFVPSHILF